MSTNAKARLLLLVFVPAVLALAALDLVFPDLRAGSAGVAATLIPAVWLLGWIVPLMHRSIPGLAVFLTGHQILFWLRLALINGYDIAPGPDAMLRGLGALLLLVPMVRYAGKEAAHAFERD